MLPRPRPRARPAFRAGSHYKMASRNAWIPNANGECKCDYNEIGVRLVCGLSLKGWTESEGANGKEGGGAYEARKTGYWNCFWKPLTRKPGQPQPQPSAARPDMRAFDTMPVRVNIKPPTNLTHFPNFPHPSPANKGHNFMGLQLLEHTHVKASGQFLIAFGAQLWFLP